MTNADILLVKYYTSKFCVRKSVVFSISFELLSVKNTKSIIDIEI